MDSIRNWADNGDLSQTKKGLLKVPAKETVRAKCLS